MRIDDLRSLTTSNGTRIEASVTWEDCDRPPQQIFFETDERYSEHLSCNPHAFLTACILPAMRHGEVRLAIDDVICPELRNGLLTVMGWICHWYGPPRKPIRIEAKKGTRPPLPRTARRASSFLSGGVDSLATLRANRLDFPLNHPRSIKDCLIVHGFDIGAFEGADREIETFEQALASLSPVTEDAGVTLIPVFTNIRHLHDDVHFWMYEFHGAALASVAHAFSSQLSSVSIASGFPIANLEPWGSHPLLDPNYSSVELQVRHEGLRLSRLEKVRLVADWSVALQNMRVCTLNPAGMLNCGKCEKCIRTMIELLAIGKLNDTHAFPANSVFKDSLGGMKINTEYLYRELIEPLTAMGQLDLVNAIETKSAELHKHLAWVEERDWKGTVKRFDRQYLRGNLFRTYKAIRGRVIKA